MSRYRYRMLSAAAVLMIATYFLSVRLGQRRSKSQEGPPRGGRKTVLLTGAGGFIGFHTSLALHARGDVVVGLDNMNHYYDVRLKQARSAMLRTKGVEVVNGDVCDTSRLKQLFAKHRFTHVVHMAAQAGVRYSLNHPQEYVRANVQCFVSLMEVMRHYARETTLVYASSSSVYGLNTKYPFSEADRVDTPASLYAATKKENELIAHVYHNPYQVRSTGLRFFTVSGPGGRPDIAYFSFAERIVDGRPITVFNHGKMGRDFTYIDDIVAGIVGAVDLGAELEVFNLGGDEPVELMRFIHALETALGAKAQMKFAPMAKGDVLRTAADVSKARNLLGYDPRTPVEEGLRKFARWFKKFKAGDYDDVLNAPLPPVTKGRLP